MLMQVSSMETCQNFFQKLDLEQPEVASFLAAALVMMMFSLLYEAAFSSELAPQVKKCIYCSQKGDTKSSFRVT
jgi:hypothetical protein